MGIFNSQVTVEKLNIINKGSLAGHLGIEITEIGLDFIEAKMPIDERTKQPYGVLHGGASLALAETVGSIAGNAVLTNENNHCVGLEINGNHLRSVASGWVYARATPLHIGKRTQVWEIKISTETKKLACIARLTLAVVEND